MIRTEIINLFQKKTILALSIGAASFVMAQQKLNVSGNVKDANGGVGYASVTFKNTLNAQLSDAVLTDIEGNYKLELSPGKYDVSIEAIDHKLFSKKIDITTAGVIPTFVVESAGKANLTNTTNIEGVVITAASTKAYKVDLDKKTYDPSQDLISKGGNLQDVLSNVPSVSVDTDGTVSMRGSSNVRFLINGKPSALLGIDDGANALQSIPADQIEKIEVITNASSKYEASGTAGILNIILKKNKKMGFNGSVVGSLGYLPQTNLNTNLSWRKGDFTWFVNGGGGYRESENTNENDAWFYSGDLREQRQRGKTKNKSSNYNASAGLTYDISPKTSVNISGTVRGFDSNSDGNIDYNYFYADNTASYTQRKTNGKNNNLALQGDLGLDHKFDDKGQNLSLSLSLQKNKSDNNTDINEFENDIFELRNLIYQKTDTKALIGKADYELPIGENSRLEAGYRIDIRENKYNNDVLEATVANPTLDFLPRYTYNATYKEMFNSFYVQFKSKIGPIGYQIGLRDEISNVDIDYANLIPSENIKTKKSYNNLFPTVFLSYEFSKDNQLLLNYSRRIDRPRSYFLIPNPNYNDNQNIFLGNIDLNPAYTDSFELGYSISKRKLTINPTLYFRHQKDDVKTLVFNDMQDGRVIFLTKPINLGTDDRYGLDLNFNWEATNWLRFMGNIDLFGYKTTGSTDYETLDQNGNPTIAVANFDGSGFSTSSRLTASFKVDKSFSFQLQGFYRGGRKTEFQHRKDMYALNFGASKTIWKGDGTIAFNIQDIFNTRGMRNTTYNAASIRDSYMQWQPRQFSVSLTYRFKQGEKIEAPKKKRDNNNNYNDEGDMQGPM